MRSFPLPLPKQHLLHGYRGFRFSLEILWAPGHIDDIAPLYIVLINDLMDTLYPRLRYLPSLLGQHPCGRVPPSTLDHGDPSV